ncbi:MAG: cell division protein ZapA [Lewinella sp.]|nr:cell division protein ZapA [Lewinella sp.]
MDGQDSKSIKVMIAGRPYPLKIQESDEPTIHRIVKEVNDEVNRFSAMYSNLDKQDCLSMTLLTYAVDLHKAKQTAVDPSEEEVRAKLAQIEALLDKLTV